MTANTNPMPYTDKKPVGAADFYFAINATFRFILKQFGPEGLRRYWTEMGARYYQPVTQKWQQGGLPGVAEYWRAFFKAEPGAEVEVNETTDAVTLQVKVCPAIKHLREHGREVVPGYCQHCYFVCESMAAPAGLTVRVLGGNGSCVQRFVKHEACVEPQNLADIKEAL